MGIRVGVDLPEELLRSIEKEAARRSFSTEDVCREAIEARFPAANKASDPEFQEQLRIAREGMRRYRDTLRELAR